LEKFLEKILLELSMRVQLTQLDTWLRGRAERMRACRFR
jgi:hypothetical protein